MCQKACLYSMVSSLVLHHHLDGSVITIIWIATLSTERLLLQCKLAKNEVTSVVQCGLNSDYPIFITSAYTRWLHPNYIKHRDDLVLQLKFPLPSLKIHKIQSTFSIYELEETDHISCESRVKYWAIILNFNHFLQYQKLLGLGLGFVLFNDTWSK